MYPLLQLIVLLLSIDGAYFIGDTSTSDQLNEIANDYWEWKIEEFPTWATEQGFHKHEDKLEEYSLNAFERRQAKCQELLNQIKSVDRLNLTRTEQADYAALRGEIEIFLEGYEWRFYGAATPFVHRNPSWLEKLMESHFKTKRDYQNYLRRLKDYSGQINQATRLMEESMSRKTTHHRLTMESWGKYIDKHLVPYNETIFYKPFLKKLPELNISLNEQEALKIEAIDVISTQIQLAFQELKQFVQETYIPQSRPDIGVSSLPNGKAYYNACLKFHIGDTYTAKDVYELGLKEVARIDAEMRKITTAQGFEGSPVEFFKFIKKQNYNKYFGRNEEEIIEHYRSIIRNKINPNLNKVLLEIYPELLTVRVEPSPYSTSIGGYNVGVFVAGVAQSEERALFNMVAYALHETNPGHHLQHVYATHQELPKFRKYISGHNYQAVPYTIPWYTAYTEGWGLYAEYLGEEMGAYDAEDLELLGKYTSEIFRACRLVVDTGIHAFGWTFEQSVDYVANYTLMPRRTIEGEIIRYITWPGQATSYKIGELEIKKLRQNAEERLGSAFDPRSFHQKVLSTGRVPLGSLRKHLEEWTEARSNSSPCLKIAPFTILISTVLCLSVTLIQKNIILYA